MSLMYWLSYPTMSQSSLSRHKPEPGVSTMSEGLFKSSGQYLLQPFLKNFLLAKTELHGQVIEHSANFVSQNSCKCVMKMIIEYDFSLLQDHAYSEDIQTGSSLNWSPVHSFHSSQQLQRAGSTHTFYRHGSPHFLKV